MKVKQKVKQRSKKFKKNLFEKVIIVLTLSHHTLVFPHVPLKKENKQKQKCFSFFQKKNKLIFHNKKNSLKQKKKRKTFFQA